MARGEERSQQDARDKVVVVWRSKKFLERVALYVAGFTVIVMLDPFTPLGVADWLLEMILVGAACVWGETLEMYVVAAAGTATMIAGVWSSPGGQVPLWVGLLNRLVAVTAIWTMVYVARKRRLAEAARRQAAAHAKVLQGLLPICCVCKAIRKGTGEWDRLETFLLHHSEATLTHTYCPACAKKLAPEVEVTTGQEAHGR